LPAGSPSIGFLTFLIVIVVIVAGVGAGLLYLHNHPNAPSSPTTVAVGDNVTVNYIGLFGSGPEQGKVFDTSIQAVATDNATYPKSLEYSPRATSGYTPLPVHVGPNTPSSGYNVSGVTYGGVVTGFWKGLVGLAVNQTRYVTVPANEGYGALDTSCLRTSPLVTSIPALVVDTPAAFAKAYPKATAAFGSTFTDPTYGWTDTVRSANSTAVVVALGATVGADVTPYGWTMLVTNVTTQTITLHSQLTPASVGNVLGNIANVTVCTTTKFILWSVDLAAGTFTANYNKEVVGETLTFIVTVVAIH
jgi:hypothetical protein